jgi:cytidyltransferase-like protein
VSMLSSRVVAAGSFDDITSRDIRFLQEASRLGELTLLLWPDALVQKFTGRPPKFPFVERKYFLEAIRYVSRVVDADASRDPDGLPQSLNVNIWADYQSSSARSVPEACARKNAIEYRFFSDKDLKGFPDPGFEPSPPRNKKVIVTGCYDWLHSGHVRFFEEVSRCGDLYVVVGHDTNIRLLKGEGHPLLCQEERRYAVGAIKYVKQALISSGDGWLDADPEIRKLRPDIYAVNEDGDVGGKRDYCNGLGIEYRVFKRTPAAGLPARTSTALRGF